MDFLSNWKENKDNIRARLTNTFAACIFISSGLRFLSNLISAYPTELAGYEKFRFVILNTFSFSMQIILVFVFFGRRKPGKVDKNILSGVTAIVSTFLPGYFNFRNFKPYFLLDLFVYFGTLLSIASIVTLGKSFGVRVANRGIVKKGTYKFVRHPIYSGYFLTNFSLFIASSFDSFRTFLFGLWLVSLLTRIYFEERFLLSVSEYKKYANQVKYRLLPGIW